MPRSVPNPLSPWPFVALFMLLGIHAGWARVFISQADYDSAKDAAGMAPAGGPVSASVVVTPTMVSASVPAVSATVPISATVQAPKAKGTPFDVTADSVTYDTSSSRVVAVGKPGNPVVVSGTDGTLRAHAVTYDVNANLVHADGDVVYTTTDSTTLHVDHLDVTGDLTKGNVADISMSVPELGKIASADSAHISGTIYTLDNVTYSPCKTCEGAVKPWQIKASKVIYRQDKKDLTYHNAVMDVYGVPVMYLPWFRHTIDANTPKNGLLPPQFGKSQTLGDEITVGGYVFNPAENADYTLRNRLMSLRGDLISLQRRQQTLTTTNEFQVHYLNDNETGSSRSDFMLNVEKDLSDSRRIGINAETASDKTFLSQFYNRHDPYLASTVYGEDAGEHHYAALSLTRFENLSPTAAFASTAQVLPHLELERWFNLGGGQLSLNGDMVNIYRSQGVQTRRIVASADYSRPWLLDDGSMLTFGAELRGDVYNTENSDGSSGVENGTLFRGLPEATLTWEKPYISPDGTHTIAPKVMLIASPRGGNNTKIPNEDSVSYELDTSNLFETSRFTGLDRVETGPRLVYGLDNRWGTPNKTDWRFFFGQSLRAFDDSSLPASGGASTKSSDWVGEIEAHPTDWFSLTNSFRLDNATFIPRRMDSSMQIGRLSGSWFRLTHSYLDNGPQEIYGEGWVPLNDRWGLHGLVRDDLANSVLLEGEAGLVWTRDCYQLEFIARRRGFTNADLQPSTDYMINVKLLTLGGR